MRDTSNANTSSMGSDQGERLEKKKRERQLHALALFVRIHSTKCGNVKHPSTQKPSRDIFSASLV